MEALEKNLINFLSPEPGLLSKQEVDKELGEALFETLEGIRKDLDMSQTDFCSMLHIKESTYSGWKKNKRISLGSPLNLEDISLLKFIDIYDCITSLYPYKEDYISWFFEPLLENKSPIELMRSNPEYVLDLNSYTNWLINP
jgi:transcriptional regulator with XRE-family HTH domain